MLIYKNRVRSYRDLPMRFAELGTVYRYEPSGTLRGLLRVRGFTQDDTHLFCRPDQMSAEIEWVLDFCTSVLASYGFNIPEMESSVRDPRAPEKYSGSDADWQMAESTLAAALDAHGLPYRRMEGEAVYLRSEDRHEDSRRPGPQLAGVYHPVRLNLLERFDLTYVGADNRPHRPYRVHRALCGSIERFFALLVEHYSGALPVWLAPTQAVVIPVSERNLNYARRVNDGLAAAGFRAEVDDRAERINAKIRDAQLQKVPYMLVVGNREEQANGVSVRLRTNEDRGLTDLPGFVDHLREVVKKQNWPLIAQHFESLRRKQE